MKLKICNFDISRQLKEIGFDIITRELYRNSNGSRCILLSDKTAYKDIYTYAPTLALIQMWLREEHEISIQIDDYISNSKIRYDYCVKLLGLQDFDWVGTFEEYDQALETGILESINLIKTKQDDSHK